MIENKIPYTQIHEKSILDNSISDGAFRIYAFLLSCESGFSITETNIKRNLQRLNTNSLDNYLNELEEAGWIEKVNNMWVIQIEKQK